MSAPDAAAVLALWVAYLWQSAYETGRADERARIGDALHEADACWEALGELDACRQRAPRTWEQQVAERVAAYEEHADGPAWPGHAGMSPRQRQAAYRALLDSWDQPAAERKPWGRRAAA